MQYTGIVQKGGQRAAALGFPTVNIPLDDARPAKGGVNVSGIYAARVKVGEEEYNAVAYADHKNKRLEAHIFDFAADLYGWNITVQLLKKMRESKKFSDDTQAKAAIAEDAASVREYFAHL